MYISVVEDNPEVLAMVKTALTLRGHIVDTYSNSSSFLSTLQKAERTPPYDLVIVDLFLGRQSGIDVVEALRIAQPQTIPAILISAAEESTLAPIRKRYPNLPILQKPFKIHALASLIDEVTSCLAKKMG
ncbi:MAG: response regulator [Ktedonobacteraceae bacterium]